VRGVHVLHVVAHAAQEHVAAAGVTRGGQAAGAGACTHTADDPETKKECHHQW
jgi:hypothetical protein